MKTKVLILVGAFIQCYFSVYGQSFKLPWPSGSTYCVSRTGSGATFTFPSYCPGTTCGSSTSDHGYQAIDFALPSGTNVLAPASGTVVYAWFNATGTTPLTGGYGNLVKIRHSDNTYTYYAHLNQIGVKVSDVVSQGCLLGKSGSTGHSSGPHLHFERRDAGEARFTSDSDWPIFSEYNCTPNQNRQYTSQNAMQNCTSNFSLNCSNAVSITCGQSINGQTTGNGFANNVTTGDFSNVSSNPYNSWNDPGPEDVYQISVSNGASFTATLSNMASGLDLDVFILNGCNVTSNPGNVTVSSTSSSITNAAAGTYFILVDGAGTMYPSGQTGTPYNGNYGSYTLTITGNCGVSCTPPNDECSGAINLSLSSGNTTCASSGETVACATQSFAANSCNGTSSSAYDVWFKFTPIGTGSYTITMTPSSSSSPAWDGVLELFQVNPCSGSTSYLACADPTGGANNATVTLQRTISNTNIHYIRVYNYGSASAQPSNPTFSLCITAPNATCTYSISPPSVPVSSSSGSGSVSVTTTSGCNWTAVSNNPSWLTVTPGSSSGTGNGTVNYSYISNGSSGSRTGTITIAGNTFTVTQAGTISSSISGVDVSNYNGSVNWSTVYAAGKIFSYVKATEGYLPPGNVDPRFQSNMTSSNPDGVVLGAYHLGRPDFSSNNTPANETSNFLAVAGNYIGNGFLPPALDMEPTYIDAYIAQGNSYTQLAQWINTWCSLVHTSSGKWPVLYTTKCYAAILYQNGTINSNDIKLWIATNNTSTDPAGSPGTTSCSASWSGWQWLFHQYWVPCNSCASNDPSTGMDLNVFNGDINAFNNLIRND